MRIDVDRVRAQIDLVEIVQRDTKLRRCGKTWRGRCPLHGGDRDSLRVRGVTWSCFACQERGDAIDWIMKTQGLTFRAAVESLVPGLGNPDVDPAEDPATWDAVEAKIRRERPEYLRRVEQLTDADFEWFAFEGKPITWRQAEEQAERRLLREAPQTWKLGPSAPLSMWRMVLAQLAQHG